MKALITATAVMALFATQSQAEVTCVDRDEGINTLEGEHGEYRQIIGLDSRDVVIEVWANQATGTFTITLTGTGGQMCQIMSGAGYQRFTGERTQRGSKL